MIVLHTFLSCIEYYSIHVTCYQRYKALQVYKAYRNVFVDNMYNGSYAAYNKTTNKIMTLTYMAKCQRKYFKSTRFFTMFKIVFIVLSVTLMFPFTHKLLCS